MHDIFDLHLDLNQSTHNDDWIMAAIIILTQSLKLKLLHIEFEVQEAQIILLLRCNLKGQVCFKQSAF